MLLRTGGWLSHSSCDRVESAFVQLGRGTLQVHWGPSSCALTCWVGSVVPGAPWRVRCNGRVCCVGADAWTATAVACSYLPSSIEIEGFRQQRDELVAGVERLDKLGRRADLQNYEPPARFLHSPDGGITAAHPARRPNAIPLIIAPVYCDPPPLANRPSPLPFSRRTS